MTEKIFLCFTVFQVPPAVFLRIKKCARMMRATDETGLSNGLSCLQGEISVIMHEIRNSVGKDDTYV